MFGPGSLIGFVLPFVTLLAFVSGGILYVHTNNSASSVRTHQVKSVRQTPAKTPPAEKPATLDTFSSVIANAKDSVVKITGTGCGYDLSGTGFVVAPDLVITNAHGVAGVSSPYVHDSTGSHEATTVFFDPKLDIAVLRTDDLAGHPLTLDVPTAGLTVAGTHNGDHDVMLGYPGGGDFSAKLADISDELSAETSDIYGNPNDIRDVYELNADIVQGSSGSPLIQQNGLVAGIIFGMSPTESRFGYALPASQFFGEVERAKSLHDPVDTQTCTVDAGG